MHVSTVLQIGSLFFVSAAALTGSAFAQTYPAKPVRIIDGFAPGGSSDIVARVMAPKFQEAFGQPLIVDNRAGAQGIIGADAVAKAAPDGYTLFVMTGTHTVHPVTYRNMPYQFPQAFAPITLTSTISQVLAVHPSVPVRTVKELIALAKTKPGRLNFGAGGTGPQMTGELFNSMAGTKITFVGYKGGAPAVLATVMGEVDVTFATMPTAVAYVRAGRLRALGVCTSKRSVVLPNLPTVAEVGVPGYESTNSVGILAPAGTPRDIVAKLHQEITRILAMPDVRERLLVAGIEPAPQMTPEQFADYLRNEVVKWGKVVKAANIQVQTF
ncbi:MAG TPA: tripartite tricarboxylate transporter substrate binding protein [Burkholderiales bacterium]|nr:tripartite tricarboxylate transporter substrate binding protein [Burkholderiales bacterium]